VDLFIKTVKRDSGSCKTMTSDADLAFEMDLLARRWRWAGWRWAGWRFTASAIARFPRTARLFARSLDLLLDLRFIVLSPVIELIVVFR
jgi:hypothetical protein